MKHESLLTIIGKIKEARADLQRRANSTHYPCWAEIGIMNVLNHLDEAEAQLTTTRSDLVAKLLAETMP